MPKTPSRRLFELIKSLSGSEKRYFKIATKKDRGSKYLQLFQAIEEQTVFDDETLQKVVYGQEVVTSRKYSELKAYLYDMLLRSLQQYDEQTSVDYQLKNMLLSVRSLYRRWLLDDCKYLLKRVKKIALKYESFHIIIEVLDWEKQLAYAGADVDFFEKHLASLQLEEEDCLAKMSKVKAYQGLFYELYLLMRKNKQQSTERQKRLDRISSHPLLSGEEQADSFWAKVYYYRIQSFISHLSRQLEDFHRWCTQLVELMESRPFLLREDPSLYIAALSNYTVSCGYLTKHDAMRLSLQKLKKVEPSSVDDRLKIHSQYYNNYFALCIRTGNFEEGLQLLKHHLKEVKNLDKKLFKRSHFYFQYFYIYFGVGNYNQSLIHLNKWLNLPKSVEQQNLQHLARLLNLIIHFEMGNTILLSSLLRSTQRSLQKQNRWNSFEQVLVQSLRQAIQLPSFREQQLLFKNSLEQFMEIALSPADHALLRFFDFKSWLQSKAERRDFASVMQENTKPTIKAQ